MHPYTIGSVMLTGPKPMMLLVIDKQSHSYAGIKSKM